MAKIILLFVLISFLPHHEILGQKIEKIKVPKGIVYNYCDAATFEKAKKIIGEELSENPTYKLTGKLMFIGPVLWSRFQQIESLKSIPGGNTTLVVDSKKLTAKLTQEIEDSKKVWDEVRKEINGTDYALRKAKPDELQYYWSVISFDIDEPLVILETAKIKYILNIRPKTMELLWLDQIP